MCLTAPEEMRRGGKLVFREKKECSISAAGARDRPGNISSALPQKSIPIQEKHLSICLCLSTCSNPVDLNRNEAYVFK